VCGGRLPAAQQEIRHPERRTQTGQRSQASVPELAQVQTKRSVRLPEAVVSHKAVILSLDPHRIGDPRTIRFSVAAGREMNKGTGGGGDLAPDKGTSPLWVR